MRADGIVIGTVLGSRVLGCCCGPEGIGLLLTAPEITSSLLTAPYAGCDKLIGLRFEKLILLAGLAGFHGKYNVMEQ